MNNSRFSVCFIAVFVALVFADRAHAGTEVKIFTLATGEVLAFPFENGIPKPSQSAWATCSGAGPSIQPENNGYRLAWVVNLAAKTPGGLKGLSRAIVQEVSGKKAVQLFSGKPETTEKGILIIAPAELITRFQYPWLYTADRTILILRVQLERSGAKPDVLIQPVLIGPEVKQQLKDRGYLP